MHKITQFFYRFSLYFTAVITGILLVMSMVCMYGYKEYLSGGNYALGNVAVILLAIALGVLLVTLYRKMQGTGQKATVVLFLAIILLQIGFLVFVSHPMSISDPARVQNEALQMVISDRHHTCCHSEYCAEYLLCGYRYLYYVSNRKEIAGYRICELGVITLFALPDDLCMADNSIYQYDLVSVCYGGAVSGVMAAP